MKRVLALDIGDVRTGIATGDLGHKIAMPVCVLPTQEVLDCARTFRVILEDHEPELLVCGLPLSLSGEDSSQTALTRERIARIAAKTQLPCVEWDERLSSREAKMILRKQGLDERKMRGKVDMVAASLFLQSWIDAQGSHESCDELMG